MLNPSLPVDFPIMNPVALVKNAVRSTRICPTWNDRFNYLGWLYSTKLNHGKRTNRQRGISFCYTTPVRNIDVVVRDNGGSDAFIFSEVFSHRYYDFDLPYTPETILDLGANAGFTSIFFARKYPGARIIAVEPIASNLEILRRNVELNHLDVTIVPAAIAVEDGSVTMDVSGLDYGHQVIADLVERPKHSSISKVKAISMRSLMAEFKLERISLLKIDIEGYEKRLLTENCDWLSRVDAICIELHDGYSEDDLSSLAADYGFSEPQRLPGIWLLTRAVSR
jgi:FkbM family methyltransferase